MIKLVSFRLDDATLQNLDTIKALVAKFRQAPWWSQVETRTSALKYAVSIVASDLIKKEQERQEKEIVTKPKKKSKVKK